MKKYGNNGLNKCIVNLTKDNLTVQIWQGNLNRYYYYYYTFLHLPVFLSFSSAPDLPHPAILLITIILLWVFLPFIRDLHYQPSQESQFPTK